MINDHIQENYNKLTKNKTKRNIKNEYNDIKKRNVIVKQYRTCNENYLTV